MSDDQVIYADKTNLQRASHKQLISEVLRLRRLLDRCWAAAGLLGSQMTGQPAQAWEEPSDLESQIEQLSSDADNWREEEDESARLRAALELLAQVRHVSGSAQGHVRNWLRFMDAVLAGADVRDLATVEAIAAGTWKPPATEGTR